MRLMVDGQKQTLHLIRSAKQRLQCNGFDVWFHVASLGEFEQARPVIERYRQANPSHKILLSFFSPSGYEVRKTYAGADCVVYLPFDTPSQARAFLDEANPRKAVFIKYEFWGNYITGLQRRGVPVYLVSAIFRSSQSFFQAYGGIMRGILRAYTHFFVQDEASKKLLHGIGQDNVTVCGDTRLDRVCEICDTAQPIPVIDTWTANSPFKIVVGSSWAADEDCYTDWLMAHPNVKAIVAPHQFDAARLQTLLKRFKGRAVLWSETGAVDKPIPAEAQILIIDCFGLLSRLYRYADVAIVGGGLGAGIHNVPEAAVYGIPVAFGPNNKKFKEAQDLLAVGAAQQYIDAITLSRILDNWHTNLPQRQQAGTAAATYIRSNAGATTAVLHHLLL